MKGELTVIIEKDPDGGGYWGFCPEIPGANGQGETVSEVKESIKAAVILISKDKLEDAIRGLPKDILQESIAI